MFGIEAEATDITAGELNRAGYRSVARQLADRFGFEKVAITLRESRSAVDNDWSTMLYDGTDCFFSKQYHLHIVDRIGGGDSFGGALIYALLSGKSNQAAVEFAAAVPLPIIIGKEAICNITSELEHRKSGYAERNSSGLLSRA